MRLQTFLRTRDELLERLMDHGRQMGSWRKVRLTGWQGAAPLYWCLKSVTGMVRP